MRLVPVPSYHTLAVTVNARSPVPAGSTDSVGFLARSEGHLRKEEGGSSTTRRGPLPLCGHGGWRVHLAGEPQLVNSSQPWPVWSVPNMPAHSLYALSNEVRMGPVELGPS